MKLSTIQNAYVPVLRTLAESKASVGATAQADGPVEVAGQKFALHPQLAALPGAHLVVAARPAADDQVETLKILARDLILPGIKAAWPGASNVITGALVIWATAEFWNTVQDPSKDSHQKTIAGVRLVNGIAGFGLSIQQAPSDAVLVNTISGLVIATADKLYAFELDKKQDGRVG